MASENLAKLQAIVNRYAKGAGFSPLAIDGGMGPKTEDATRRSVQFAADKFSTVQSGAASLALDFERAGAGAGAQTLIMQSLVHLGDVLTRAADELKLPGAATVVATKPAAPVSGGGLPTPDKSAFGVKPPPGAGFLDKSRLWFRQLPTWQQVGVGVGSGIALLFGLTSFGIIKKRKAATSGTAGYRRRSR